MTTGKLKQNVDNLQISKLILLVRFWKIQDE